jgi:hypothetical protein
MVLGFGLRSSCLLGRCSTTWVTLPVQYVCFYGKQWRRITRRKEDIRTSIIVLKPAISYLFCSGYKQKIIGYLDVALRTLGRICVKKIFIIIKRIFRKATINCTGKHLKELYNLGLKAAFLPCRFLVLFSPFAGCWQDLCFIDHVTMILNNVFNNSSLLHCLHSTEITA